MFLISWHEQLRRIKAELAASRKAAAPPARVPDPWEAKLAELTGELHDDGYERVPTYVAFEHLGVRGSERRSGAAPARTRDAAARMEDRALPADTRLLSAGARLPPCCMREG